MAKTKIVYCLSDTSSYFYAEQLLVSLISLRIYNPIIPVTVLIDSLCLNKSSSNTKKTIERISKIADEVVFVDLDDSLNDKIRSRLLKTSIRNRLKGNLLYLDTDTVVCSKLKLETLNELEIAAVYNTNKKELDQSPHYHAFQYIAEKCNVVLIDNTLYNGGVIYSKDTSISKALFRDWHRLYIEFYRNYGVTSDQISLYASNKLNGSVITPLPGEWNCQLGYGINEMADVKIMHTLISSYGQMGREKSSLHLLQQQSIYKSINKRLVSEAEIEKIVVNIKHLFLPDSRIVHKFGYLKKMQELKIFSQKYRPMYLFSENGDSDVVVNTLKKNGILIDKVLTSFSSDDENRQNVGICITSNDNTDINKILEKLLENGIRHIFVL